MAQKVVRYQAVPAPSKIAGANIEAEDDEPSSNVASSNLSTMSSRRRPRKTIIFKSLLVLVGGYLVLAGAAAYLTFLWFGQHTGHIWSRIVLHNWATTSVVVSALAIRTIVATQTSFLCSMLALTVLKSGAQVGQIPRLSSLRYSNSGPSDLLYLLFPPVRSTHLLGAFSLTIILAILTLLLQFTSTLLASDLSPDLTETFANQSHSPVLWDRSTDLYGNTVWTDPLTSNPVTFPKFAELSNRSDATQRLPADRYDDTGPSLRAILPVATEQGRSDLRSFKGNASVYDARWICTRPSFNISTLQLRGTGGVNTLSGTFTLDNPRPPIADGSGTWFRCEQRYSQRSDPARWRLTTCDMAGTGLVNALLSDYNTKEQYYVNDNWDVTRARNDSDGKRLTDVLGDAFLVINQTDYEPEDENLLFSNGSQWKFQGNVSTLLDESAGGPTYEVGLNYNSSWAMDHHGHWTSLTSTQAAVNLSLIQKYNWTGLTWPFRLDISVCISGHNRLKNVYIEANGQSSQPEPANVTTGIRQLGLTTNVYDLDERGILALDESFRGPLEQNSDVAGFYFGLATRDGVAVPSRAWYAYTGLDEPLSYRGVHESRVDLFQDVLRETGSLALAMQSAAHTAITTQYYRYMPYFSNDSLLTTTFSTTAVQPTRIRGYVVVMITVSLYTLVTLLTIFMLVGLHNWRYIADSMDQSWQAYAQVWTLRDAADQELFRDGAKATKEMTVQTDAAVQKDFRRQQRLDKQVFALEEDEDGHRVFRRREYKSPKD